RRHRFALGRKSALRGAVWGRKSLPAGGAASATRDTLRAGVRFTARKAPPRGRGAWRGLAGGGDGFAGPDSSVATGPARRKAARNRPAARRRRAVFHLRAQRRRRRSRRPAAATS